jgi:hypothetical protein
MTTLRVRNPQKLRRREVVARLVRDRTKLVAISSLGSPTYDLAAAGDCACNFYLWGAMVGFATRPANLTLCLLEEVERLAKRVGVIGGGPTVAVIKVDGEDLPRVVRSRDGVYLKTRLRSALGLTTS